jgi:hypothetical protein
MGRAEAASRLSWHDEVSASMARMSNDSLQPSEAEVADQVMADAEGGVESSTLDAPEDEPDSPEPD